MSAAIFPAYALARFVVSRPYALFAAAVLAVASPPLAYAPYPARRAARLSRSRRFALWAIAAAVARPTGSRLLAAGALCLVAPFVRGELAVLLVIYAVGLGFLGWRTERFARWRSTWTTGDWLGAALLVGRSRNRLQRGCRPPLRSRGTWRPAS